MRFLSLKGLFKFIVVVEVIFANMALLVYLVVTTFNALDSLIAKSPFILLAAVLLVISACIFFMLLILNYFFDMLA